MFTAPTTTKPAPTAGFLAALRRLLQRAPAPHPLLLQALLPQVPHLRTVHQVAQLRHLAASWLGRPQLQLLDLHLQERLRLLGLQKSLPQPSPRSSSSRTKTARRTGKRRR